jgi:hypothetical protein
VKANKRQPTGLLHQYNKCMRDLKKNPSCETQRAALFNGAAAAVAELKGRLGRPKDSLMIKVEEPD